MAAVAVRHSPSATGLSAAPVEFTAGTRRERRIRRRTQCGQRGNRRRTPSRGGRTAAACCDAVALSRVWSTSTAGRTSRHGRRRGPASQGCAATGVREPRNVVHMEGAVPALTGCAWAKQVNSWREALPGATEKNAGALPRWLRHSGVAEMCRGASVGRRAIPTGIVGAGSYRSGHWRAGDVVLFEHRRYPAAPPEDVRSSASHRSPPPRYVRRECRRRFGLGRGHRRRGVQAAR